MFASSLPIAQLGATIKVHLSAAEKYLGKSEDHYKSAGIHLLEAKARIAAGEYNGKFSVFLSQECDCLSSARAYELISIANGTKTIESIRERSAESMRQSRSNAKAAAFCNVAESKAKKSVAPVVRNPVDDVVLEISKACKGLSLESATAVLAFVRGLGGSA